MKDGPGFAVAWLGILTEERRLRSIEHDCTQRLRDQGLVR